MSAKKKVIHHRNLPFRSPFGFGLVMWLALDRLSAPGWVWGAVGCLFLFLVATWIVSIWTEEDVDIFELKGKQ